MTDYRYLTDAYLTCLEAEVLSCQPAARGFEVMLSDTLLFPGGGGQPEDAGALNGHPVLGLARGEDGQVRHRVAQPLSGVVQVILNWPRRFDHMQQHTAQHVVTATAGALAGLRTLAFHLGPESCDIELDTTRLSDDELETLEGRGGGPPGLFQGQALRLDLAPRLARDLEP